MNQKNQKGITLIALVVTIIVLLILAGVTLNMVLGNDGIIGQAQQAKKAQEDKEQEEQDELDKGAGNIDLYKENSLASKVNVGDYVKYVYTEAEYNTDDTADIGAPQKFNSALIEDTDGVKNAQIDSLWRVLSKKGGIVKIVPEIPGADLQLKGANGWLNGPTVLNKMCEALYSSDIGKARSINVDDINEIAKYDGTKFYFDKNGEKVFIPANETKTIGELENELGVEITKTSTPDGRDISEYEVDCYTYNLLNDSYANKWITANSEEYKVLFGEDGLSFYWLASKCVDLRIQNDMARYDMRLVREGAVDIKILMASNGNGVGGGYPVYPIVTLNSGLEVEGGTGEKGNPWTIKIVNE